MCAEELGSMGQLNVLMHLNPLFEGKWGMTQQAKIYDVAQQ
jgi:hypothetical protein